MRTDMEIQKDVVAELRWEPSLRDDDIAVGVRDGVVTLAGFVDSYGDKWTAERVASKGKGAKAIANDLEVKLPSSSTRPDGSFTSTSLAMAFTPLTLLADRKSTRLNSSH